MKKAIKNVIAIVFVAASIVSGAYWWHTNEMNALSQQLSEEHARQDLMRQRIQEIEADLVSTEAEKQSLLEKVDELLAEEVVVFDSESIMEKILEIGELSTLEYRYTNVGTLESSKKFSFVDWTIPFSGKTAVVTMDGVIKIGVDMTQVKVIADESTKTITVEIPEAKFLSNELFEDTMSVYVEEDSIFSDITLEDSSSIRTDIKNKAQKNALDNDLLNQAQKKAGEIIVYLIDAVPSVKDTYTIVVQYADNRIR